MQNIPLKILLIGVGRFGHHHLAELIRLDSEGEVDFVGAVTSSEESSKAASLKYGIPVFSTLSGDLLEKVDCVDIVTPAVSHAALVRQCLPKTHVLVEKPLATSCEEAEHLVLLSQNSDRILMVGHLYRFHPAINKMKEIVSKFQGLPIAFDGTMTNSENEFHASFNTNIELLHLFDIIDFLFKIKPEIYWAKRQGLINNISIKYLGVFHATIKIGWKGPAKIRTFTLFYPDCKIECNLADNLITITQRNHQVDKIIFPKKHEALRNEILSFLKAAREKKEPEVNAATGSRIVDITLRSTPHPIDSGRRPRVGIIGGGIFGTTCALEMSSFADVTLFERHPELLQEVSFANQWRHHSGFHYPRSYDTIMEIQAARADFERVYSDAVRREYPSYFCPSRWGVEIPAERYLAACQGNKLNFIIEPPPTEAIDLSQVGLCVRSDEGVYDYYKLLDMINERLAVDRYIDIRLLTAVKDAIIEPNGRKKIYYTGKDGSGEQSFDYLINATYSGLNLVSKWFGFPVEPLRFDLYEMLVLKVPIAQVCVTIIDGPFTSLVGTGEEHMFLLSHIQHSVLKSVITDDGLPPDWGIFHSNAENMIKAASRYIPALKKAEVIDSIYATRAVNAFARDFDARPTVVRAHGFGCWSILGGKIITCVTNAREIKQQILAGESLTVNS